VKKEHEVKQEESDRDKWKQRAEKLDSDVHHLKTSVLDSKLSAIDQLYLKQEELNMKHTMKIRNDKKIGK
jgi:hypothetical protein